MTKKKEILNNNPVMHINDTYALRGVCMLMIIIHHIYKVFYSDFGYPMNQIYSMWGDLGTAVFFFLSGYGLYCSLSKQGCVSWAYVKKCFTKLLLPFVDLKTEYYDLGLEHRNETNH